MSKKKSPHRCAWCAKKGATIHVGDGRYVHPECQTGNITIITKPPSKGHGRP